jgi:hypothetical protein
VAWTVREKFTQMLTQGSWIYAIVNALLAAGCSVYGSGSGNIAFDNSGSGAVNYWVTSTIAATANAWIRIRFPTVGGVARELMIQKHASTARRWHVYWSSNGTGFTGGTPSSTVRPTATDEQFVQNASADLEATSPAESGTVRWEMVVITGDASEGYSFFAALIGRQSNSHTIQKFLFLDVLREAHASDADPAIYGACAETGFVETLSHSLFADLAVGNNDTNIGGWYRKGTGSEAWVCYPLGIGWGYPVATEAVTSFLIAEERLADCEAGSFSCWAGIYERPITLGGFTTSLGRKGKSRIFRGVVDSAGQFRLDSARRLLTCGFVVIPWDGTVFR